MLEAPGITLEGQAEIGGEPVFGPLTLQVPAAHWTCLLGPSGAGKTTILRLIAGVDDITRFTGRITASDGRPLEGRMALLAQGEQLMPWLDLPGNVTLGARLRGERPDLGRAGEVLRRVGLGRHLHKKPGALSGGQRQRVALARTLIEDRPVVLLDEPFSALDARTRADMQDLAVELLSGRTVLIVTHDPAEAARLGQRICLMTRAGLEDIAPPESPVPRPVDDAATLAFQGALLHRLRQPA